MTSDPINVRPSLGHLVEADFESLEQAAQWYATLHDEHVTEEERRSWCDWLQQRPQNSKAWQHIEAISQRFTPLRTDGIQDAAVAGMKAARVERISRRQLLRNATVLAGFSMLSWLGWRHAGLSQATQMLTADFRTSTGEIRELALDDGTRVWLNTATAINVDFNGEQRILALVAGEILIETAADALKRPFVVDTRYARLQALGTRFTVREHEYDSFLAVYQGAVRVCTEAGDTKVIQVGQQVRFDAQHIAAPEPADQARLAWSRGVLVADNLRLGDLLAELSRYQHGHIAVDPAVADWRVMGVYPARDPVATLALLQQSLPIQVRNPLPWWVSVSQRP